MTNQTSVNNKRIAKNTLYLYMRMLLSLIVQLYTSRVILNALGISDYGIYNVVGGVVTMFSFMSGTMSTAAQRFMSYAIGQGNINELRRTFVASQIILWLIALITLVAIEVIGMWLLFNHLTIPDGRLTAAIWVFQVAVISLFITIISVSNYDKLRMYFSRNQQIYVFENILTSHNGILLIKKLMRSFS